MGSDSIYRLPAYPSIGVRKTLPPTQRFTLNQKISLCLHEATVLPPSKRDDTSARTFVTTYAKDAALQVLQSLIWPSSALSKDEKLIQERTLHLADEIASGIDLQTMLDLSIIYASKNVSRMKTISEAILKSDAGYVRSVETELLPALTALLNPARGLYAIRKASHTIKSFLNASPPEVIRCFSHNQSFLLALAALYDQGLTSIAQSYGGLPTPKNRGSNTADDWEPIWAQTKVDLIDSFHIIITTCLNDVAALSGPSLTLESDRTFDIVFALLESPASNVLPNAMTPFLDRSLLADYQEAYSFSTALALALRNAGEKDPRIDILESSLQSSGSSHRSDAKKDAGALKILLGSSDVGPGSSNHHRVRSAAPAETMIINNKGKGRAPPPDTSFVSDIDVKASQVLDVLPEYPREYIQRLLEYPSYYGNPEKVVEALLEGTAPSMEHMEVTATPENSRSELDGVRQYAEGRRNVFDNEEMDVSRLRIGKAKEDASALLQDRTFIEQMKADILRRAEVISDEEEEFEIEIPSRQSKGKGVSLGYDDEDDSSVIKIGGDGEDADESLDDDDYRDGEDEDTPQRQTPETICELAYIRNPKLFDRDAQTRRSQGRAELKSLTGWSDEQIEGWRIMLERNPRKDKVLQKHEFSGNKVSLPVENNGKDKSSADGHNAHIRGRGRGAARGWSRGGRGGGSGGGSNDSTREKDWKEKNKASRGNHSRKHGHDKKMARAGAGVQT